MEIDVPKDKAELSNSQEGQLQREKEQGTGAVAL
jgi:hypothetical protein